MNLTEQALIAIAPSARNKAATFLPFINDTLQKYDITTLNRLAMFIAQLMHESLQLVYTKEMASGAAYEGRKDLGNIHKGDGVRYKGRGLIMVTGRANYATVSKDLGIDAVNHPELLESPQYATSVAGWFWNKHNLNAVADKGDFRKVTKIINGGYNGMTSRQGFYDKAIQVLKPFFLHA